MSSSSSSTTTLIGFDTQLMKRVVERVNDFMKVPVNACHLLLEHRNVRIFQYGMNAADYQHVLKELYATMIQAESRSYPTSIGIALEDGTYISYTADLVTSSYRDPGNDGYSITNIQHDENSQNYKHYTSCFNHTNGEPMECIMSVGKQYIQCVNDCELIPCNSNQSTEYSSTENNNASDSSSSISTIIPENNNNNNNHNNKNSTTWCQNYVVQTIQKGQRRGYIPATDNCMNEFGEPEQRPGFVLKDYNTKTFGNCYYSDGISLVNRSTSSTSSTSNIANNTKIGAFMLYQYDARYRWWYQEVRQQQKPIWNQPFALAYNNTMVISYTIPIYSIPPRKNETTTTATTASDETKTKQVFEGVITADYQFQMTNEFLRNEYSQTNIQVFIVEHEEPHYMIATSNSQTAVTRMVLITDERISCPEDKLNDLDLCTPVRVSIADLSKTSTTNTTVTTDSLLLYRSYEKYQQSNYSAYQPMSIKESDEIGSRAYVVQGSIFQIPGSDNMYWDVLVLSPIPTSTKDISIPGDASFVIVLFLGLLGFLACFLLFVKFLSKRNKKAMIHSDWRFTSAFLLGCSLLNVSSFCLLGVTTNATCMLRMWSFHLLFACALSPLFVKVWRMAQLLNASKGFKRQSITHYQAFLMTLPLILLQIITLLLFTFVDPPKPTEVIIVIEGYEAHHILCQQQTNAFFVTQLLLDGFLICIGCVLAYRTRDMDPKFGEAKQLGFSMYNIAFTGIVVVCASVLTDLDQESRIIIQSIGVFWGSVFCSFSFVLPRLLEVNKEENDATRRRLTETQSSFRAISRQSGGGIGIQQQHISSFWKELSEHGDVDRTSVCLTTPTKTQSVKKELSTILSSAYYKRNGWTEEEERKKNVTSKQRGIVKFCSTDDDCHSGDDDVDDDNVDQEQPICRANNSMTTATTTIPNAYEQHCFNEFNKKKKLEPITTNLNSSDINSNNETVK